jgi:hypothetical protein
MVTKAIEYLIFLDGGLRQIETGHPGDHLSNSYYVKNIFHILSEIKFIANRLSGAGAAKAEKIVPQLGQWGLAWHRFLIMKV